MAPRAKAPYKQGGRNCVCLVWKGSFFISFYLQSTYRFQYFCLSRRWSEISCIEEGFSAEARMYESWAWAREKLKCSVPIAKGLFKGPFCAWPLCSKSKVSVHKKSELIIIVKYTLPRPFFHTCICLNFARIQGRGSRNTAGKQVGLMELKKMAFGRRRRQSLEDKASRPTSKVVEQQLPDGHFQLFSTVYSLVWFFR